METTFPVERALDEERALVHALGGYSVETAGGRLVVHERIPVPRFNFVQEVRVAPGRQTAFFERALDHYFQRALRPTFRVEHPVPDFIDRTLRSLSFVPRSEPHLLLLHGAEPTPPVEETPTVVRPARAEELDTLAGFWTHERERDEFRRSLEVAWQRPNPGETLLPILALRAEKPVGAALLHSFEDLWAIHGVATQPAARGHGIATRLVREVVTRTLPHRSTVVLHSDRQRLASHLHPLGFEVIRRYAVYELPKDAELALPPVGLPGPPRWRPPRRPT